MSPRAEKGGGTNAGGGTVLSISIFEDKASAQESTRVAADWVRKHPDVLPPVTQVTAGEVIGHTVKQARLETSSRLTCEGGGQRAAVLFGL